MNIKEVDLNRLIESNIFILLYIISKNEYDIKSFSLINTGVNSYTFINSRFIEKVFERLLDIKLESLFIPCGIRGFDSK